MRVYFIEAELLSNMGDNLSQTIANYKGEKIAAPEPYKYKNSLDRKSLSGVDSYSAMALHVINNLLIKTPLRTDPIEIGTVFATEFGPMNSNMKILHTIYNEDIKFVSPKKFQSTVSNTCLGHIAIKYGFKGISTMFVGSNPFTYSYNALKLGRSDIIISGILDDYNEDFYRDFSNHLIYKDKASHGANAFLMVNDNLLDVYKDYKPVELLATTNCVINNKGSLDNLLVDQDLIMRSINVVCDKAKIDKNKIDKVYLINNSSDYLENVEHKAIGQILPGIELEEFNRVSKTGLLLASAHNLALAIDELKNRDEISYILSLGLSLGGQFSVYLLGRRNGKY